MSSVSVNASLCCGYGDCVLAAPTVFRLGENGVSQVIGQPRDDDEVTRARAAASQCPVGAIDMGEAR